MMLFAKHDYCMIMSDCSIKVYQSTFMFLYSVDGMHLKTEHGWVKIILLYSSMHICKDYCCELAHLYISSSVVS